MLTRSPSNQSNSFHQQRLTIHHLATRAVRYCGPLRTRFACRARLISPSLSRFSSVWTALPCHYHSKLIFAKRPQDSDLFVSTLPHFFEAADRLADVHALIFSARSLGQLRIHLRSRCTGLVRAWDLPPTWSSTGYPSGSYCNWFRVGPAHVRSFYGEASKFNCLESAVLWRNLSDAYSWSPRGITLRTKSWFQRQPLLPVSQSSRWGAWTPLVRACISWRCWQPHTTAYALLC